MRKRIFIFLMLNFGALAIGRLYTDSGVNSAWYQDLNKAPWTPPGWFFGVAWSVIMICFALFMAIAWKRVAHRKTLLGLFALQWVLNVMWNPIFFGWQKPALALGVISVLGLLMLGMLTIYYKTLKLLSLLMLPYVLWLLVATSLNAYILAMN